MVTAKREPAKKKPKLTNIFPGDRFAALSGVFWIFFFSAGSLLAVTIFWPPFYYMFCDGPTPLFDNFWDVWDLGLLGDMANISLVANEL